MKNTAGIDQAFFHLVALQHHIRAQITIKCKRAVAVFIQLHKSQRGIQLFIGDQAGGINAALPLWRRRVMQRRRGS